MSVKSGIIQFNLEGAYYSFEQHPFELLVVRRYMMEYFYLVVGTVYRHLIESLVLRIRVVKVQGFFYNRYCKLV